jgi:hypothetical protein
MNLYIAIFNSESGQLYLRIGFTWVRSHSFSIVWTFCATAATHQYCIMTKLKAFICIFRGSLTRADIIWRPFVVRKSCFFDIHWASTIFKRLLLRLATVLLMILLLDSSPFDWCRLELSLSLFIINSCSSKSGLWCLHLIVVRFLHAISACLTIWCLTLLLLLGLF